MDLRERIEQVLKNRPKLHCLDELSSETTEMIKNIIMNDMDIYALYKQGDFDGVLLGVGEPVIGERYSGLSFFDQKQRFKDGRLIITGTLKDIALPFIGVKLVHTKRSTYLVI